MLHDQTPSTSSSSSSSASSTNNQEQHHATRTSAESFRDIHPLTLPPPPPSAVPARRRETWDTTSHRSSSLSIASTENFTTMSREFNALLLAGSTTANHGSDNDGNSSGTAANNLLSRIREEDADDLEEMNRLAIVPDGNYPAGSPGEVTAAVSVQRVKKEEVETKIGAWQNEKVAEVNNRFKREEAIINGWENEQVQKATLWMKKVERKLEEKRARAHEKMQNEIAKAHRKAEERRASAEAKRGTKVARVLEVSNLMRAVGRAPAKRSFF